MTTYIDEEQFLSEYEDSMDIIEMMLPKFEVGVKESVVKLEGLLQGTDYHALSEELHSLKGMVGNFYCPKLYDLALGMETTAKAGTADGITDSLKEFSELYPKVIAEVGTLLQRYAS
ncbi:Hpt domain-containing protein [Pseudobacteriovorax antillogorgiicola]|uniref:Hpt domain-containing protein n=1 Tax=Pseudobacteriovorax antillogorgiicola TaxID=1513793 RepID=A0A1Y6CLH7_9BACT|nr:Hpt domain-containing protein [Pseudobacteriovorax antillogorgiicola]TCS45398.1 Hpt domain-containing protein [Pseudobacteriovorax antillogorgiicola]SMF73870.1 Hpt domain-containing protein [Pseudobacteriovorax antillogorgiicola]